MRHNQVARQVVSTLVLTLLVTWSFVNAQESTPTQIPFDPIEKIPFPNLDCDDIASPFSGPSWDDILIGSSTIDDLRDYISELNSGYDENTFTSLQQITFSVPQRISEDKNIPTVISACVQPDSQQVIALVILIPPQLEQLSVSDLVIEYGVPDFVVWDEILSSRVLVWLAQGIAASISVDESEQFVLYGAVNRMVYFPYQALQGYEDRWPYTHRVASKADLVTLTPEVPNEVNPFDFDSMLATMTAEPTFTSTPVATESP
ncbi:hypothetical protein G4Y79_22745 [Phototrophicus methaneseepsis]|uniref:Uncharacterized protein n=1 Tax=Phototrophicus methaneseepsis TaxID=2710758 RepID=A0A7S8IDD4_9CHLR|nr:hypothetical protein [Phototrophicus methaneseepsis]QPC82470.1 hypothetical protein G4Y79_22745 [Phototrophicus methaneseepsis]